MKGGALNQLLATFGGGKQEVGFILVLARLTPLFIFAPLFSAKMVPRRVRGVIAVGLAVGLSPGAVHGLHIPTDAVAVLGLLVVQLLVGFGFAFAVGAVMAAVEAAGSLTDSLAGFSFGGTIDPINGNMGGVLTQFYSLVGIVVFISIGGDAWVLRGITRTFSIVPLTGGVQIRSLVAGAEQDFVSILVSAVEVAAPAMLALLVTDVGFGVVSRVMPQLNVFAVGFPMKVGVSLLVVAATLGLLGGWISEQLTGAVGTALHTLHVA